MIKKLMIVLLIGAVCLMGIAPALAQKVYPTLAEYEKLTGKTIEAFSEAPSLKVRVAAGELPPVEERLPDEPMVIEPLEEIGEYGGILRAPAIAPTSGGFDAHSARAQSLFRLCPDLKTVVPNIARGWDLSKDLKTLTVYLRKGMKWSDGAPFTADDFLFWYKDIILNDELTPVKPKTWSPGGELAKVRKVDDYTVHLQFAAPYPCIIERLSVIGSDCFSPKHSLKKYHITYNPEAGKIAKEEGYDYWWQCFNFHNLGWQAKQDVNVASLYPWALKKIDSYGNKYFERNPYYWKIDTAGNQLPYIDVQARILVENKEVENLKVIAGEFDNAAQHLTLENYPLYKGGEKKGGYRTILWKGARGSELALYPNLTHKDSVLRKIFNDIRFRQAMSLAINRGEINQILYFGKATPRQATTPPDTSFYEDWMGSYYAEYDPTKANELLDEMNLKRGKDDYRLRPDGKTLAITIAYVQQAGPRGEICELVMDYWEKVGIKVALKEMDRSFFQKRTLANEQDVTTWGFDKCTEFFMRSGNISKMFCPPWNDRNLGATVEWYKWYNTDGKTGEEPPELIKRLFKLAEDWQVTPRGTEEYMKLGKEILTINLENLYSIGTVGLAPWPGIIKNNLKNTPQEGTFLWDYRFWQPYPAEQWFFKR